MADLLQYVIQASKNLVARLLEALEKGETEIAGFIAVKQLPPLGEEMLKNAGKTITPATETEPVSALERIKKERKISAKGITLTEEQMNVLERRIGFNGRSGQGLREIFREKYPDYLGLVDARNKDYGAINFLFRKGAKKMIKVAQSGIEIGTLPESNQRFYKALREKYPDKSFEEILFSIGFGKKTFKKKGAAKERKPFR